MEIKPFSMKVNPEQSRIVQEFLFANGYSWRHHYKDVSLLYKTQIYLKSYNNDKPIIVWGEDVDYECPPITFEQFKNLYMKPTELKITPDKVLSAAEKCPQAKAVLKEMFPEVFEEDKYLDLSSIKITGAIIQKRVEGEFKDKSFCLNKSFNWEIIIDDENMICLVPTKKK